MRSESVGSWGRGPWIAVVGLALLLGCAHEPLRSGPGVAPPATVPGAPSAPGATASTTAEDPFEPPPPLRPLSPLAVAQLQREIDAVLAEPSLAGSTHSMLIMHGGTGQVLYQREPDRLLKPASNTKLVTTAAALLRLGPDHRTTTTVFAAAAPASGVLDGDLVLHGEHHYGSSAYFQREARFVFDQLAAELRVRGLTTVTGRAIARGEWVYDGHKFGTYDPAAHRAAAAAAFRDALADADISVAGVATSAELAPPAGSVALARWRGVPLAIGCSPINRFSHNEFADLLARHLGFRTSRQSSYEAGAREMTSLLAAIGLSTTGVSLFDGSGLSHQNRLAARQLVELLRYMRLQPVGEAWRRSLAVAGVRGTLRKRMEGADTSGRLFAKTGTLNGVITLSGYLDHRHDGQRYLLSLLSNEVSDKEAGRDAHDRIVAAVAANRSPLAARPPSPVLSCVRGAEQGTVVVSWQPVAKAQGYLLWRSADGRVWRRAEARYVRGTRHRTRPLQGSSLVYVKLTAHNEAGASEPSDVYGARAGAASARALVVDGNDRWQGQPQPENPTAGGHDFVVDHGRALGELPFDTCADEAVTDGTVALRAFAAVDWLAGEQSTADDTLSAAQQATLREFLQGGRALFISGSELGWDLVERGSEEDQRFFADVLRARFLGDDADTWSVGGVDVGGEADFIVGFRTPDGMDVKLADRLAPLGGAQSWLRYRGGLGGTAAIRHRGAGRLIYLGFPFESIDNAAQRGELMAAALRFFGL